jgi:hypothetical protein
MARNTNRDRLIQTFLSRNRRTTTPGYRPQKQGTVAPFKPAKRTTKPARY